jgi:hypothetical protein
VPLGHNRRLRYFLTTVNKTRGLFNL